MPKEIMAFTLDKEVADAIKRLRPGIRSHKVNQVLKKALLTPKRRRSG